MAQFQAFLPGVEVSGAAVLSVVDGMGIFRTRALHILSQHGILQPTSTQWYPQQPWLDCFRAISESIGSITLCAIGRKIPETARFPRDIVDIHSALRSIDVAYHMNHRLAGSIMFDARTGKINEGIGHYHYEADGDAKAKMVCNNPYPCDFDRGIIEAMAEHFKPSGCLFVTVKHDEHAPCRKNGDDSCTYHVSW